MRNLNFWSRFTLAAAIMCSPIFVSTSCVNSDYDLDKDINTEVNLGGTLTLPLGSTKQIRLGDMLDPEEIENLEAIDGNYKISIGDEIPITIKKLGGEDGIGIKEISDDINQTIDLNSTNIDMDDMTADFSKILLLPTGIADMKVSHSINGYNYELGITDLPAGVPLPENTEVPISNETQKFELSLGENIACPEELKSITGLDLTGSLAALTIDLTDFIAIFSEMTATLPAIEIVFPEGFVVSCSQDTDGKSDNKIKLENIVIYSTKQYIINILEFNKTLYNNDGVLDAVAGDIECLVLGDAVKVSGVTRGVTSISSDYIRLKVDADIKVADVDTEINGYYAPFNVDPIVFKETQEVDEQLVSLNRMNFTEDVYAQIDICANLDLDYAGAPELAFKDFAVIFPNFLKFEENDQVDITETDGGHSKVTLKSGHDHFTQEDGMCLFTMRVKINEIDFADYGHSILENGILAIDDQVVIEGGVQISGGKISSSNFGDKITCNIAYKIDKMSIGEVYGEVNPTIPVDADGSRIDISEITEQLDEMDITLKLANPTISLIATNPLQIPLQLSSLSLQPSKGGSTEGFDNIAIDNKITIEAADGDTPAITKVLISDKEYEGTPESGTQYVTMENLSSIINGAPDCIDIVYDAGVPPVEAGDDFHMVDLNKDYNFKLEYNVDIPLAFEEFNIDYNTVVKDLNKSLEDVVEFISALEIDLTTINDMPIELSIAKIIPQDADGNELDLQSITEDGSNKIAANGTSTLTLKLHDNENGDLKRLDRLDISVAASIDETAGGQSLNMDQTIQFKIVARVPGGVTFDPSDM